MAKSETGNPVRDDARLWEQHEPAFKQQWLAMARARDFVFKGAHYSPQARVDLERRNRIAPITNDTWDLVRFKTGVILNAEPYLDVQLAVPEELVAPTPEFDPAIGDYRAPELTPKRDPRWAKLALEQDFFDAIYGYDRVLERVVLDAIGARAGCAVLDWDPACGPRGRIFPRRKRATDVIWHSSYLHPHEPGNPFVIFRERISMTDAKALWPKAASYLKPDTWGYTDLDSVAQPLQEEPREPGKVTIYRKYQLYDWTTKFRLEPREELEKLKPQEMYMACEDCGWQGPRAGSSRLPAIQPCPQCGNIAQRIETSGRMIPTKAYAKQKLYRVVAPFCEDAGVLESRDWPGNPSTFPMMYFCPGINPDEFTGLSDTEWMSDSQCMLDAAMRISYEQMQRNRDYLFVLLNAFFDTQGEPHQFDGTGDFVAYTESPEALNAIKHFQGSGIPAAMPAWYKIVKDNMQGTRGTGQFGADPAELKGMQPGTVQRFMDQGDVPVDRAVDSYRRELSIILQCHHEMQRNLYTRADWMSIFGITGEQAFLAMRGEDLPPAQVRVIAKPMVRAADMDHAMKLRELLAAQPPLSPDEFDILAQAANLPSEWVNKIKKRLTMQDLAAQAGPAPGGPAAPQGIGGGALAAVAGRPPLPPPGANGAVQAAA